MSQRNGNVCWFVCGCRTFFVDEPAVDGYTIGEGQVLQFNRDTLISLRPARLFAPLW